ncbi:palmitoyl-protein thioesterase 1 [Coccinella septempunctata]|uniref:palmitoyl-protein thioesterase 1 n=1 Tax=Coccinella septempunctata TaxID=41139 RepID=UPI001D091A27|nr:palmitoyl-protein thioesterase 1 [Coccinella septempunctata]
MDNRVKFFWFLSALCVVQNVICAEYQNEASFTPVVLWHGMGDSCCFPFSIGGIKKKIEETLPGVHVVSLKIGKNIVDDMENGYFMHPDKQIQYACDTIKGDPLLSNGFNAVGFSQGSQFLRALVQRCQEAKMKNLITLGGQHQGVYGLPNCGGLSSKTCDYIRRLLNHAAYYGWVQKTLVQATYWHDPLNEDMYKNYSSFLSDINNELTMNQTYKDRLLTLENFVMVKFLNDSIVQPVETEWFGFYKPGQAEIVTDLRSSDLYVEDRLGLKQLDGEGKLAFLGIEGNHLEFDWKWFNSTIIEKYLKN